MEKQKTNKAEEPVSGYDGPYTYEDYLKFDFDYMVELIRGFIYKMSPAPTTIHQKVAGNFHIIFGNHFKKHKCQLFIAPTDVVLPVYNTKRKQSNTVVQPDIVIVCDQSKITEKAIIGVPDFILEVISPHTSKKDIKYKYAVYEECGVREYWIVYPMDKLVEVLLLVDGKYVRKELYTREETATLCTFSGVKVDLKEVFE